MSKGWTEERRQAQAERCRNNKPWRHATGPKTPEGKARSRLNAFKHGGRCRVFDRARYVLWLQREFLRCGLDILAEIDANEVKTRLQKPKKIKAKALHHTENPPTK